MFKKKFIIVSIILLTVSFLTVRSNFVFLTKNPSNIEIGVIDSSLCSQYSISDSNLILKKKAITETHGDRLLKFTKNYAPNVKIVYYDASNDKGEVDTLNVMKGMDTLISKGIKRINISMSTSHYSEEFEKYLLNLPIDVEVFASYSNFDRTNDYPAMYKKVVGVGKKSVIPFKKEDITYNSSKIILISNDLKLYNGNSYLSLYEAIAH